MRRVLVGAVAMLATSTMVVPAGATIEVGSQGTGSSNSYVVVLNDGVVPAAVAARHGKAHGAAVSHVYSSAIHGYAAEISQNRVGAVRADPAVRYVAEDRPFSRAGIKTKQILPNGVNRIDGELSSTRSGNGSGTVDADVAILDGGWDFAHPDVDLRPGILCIGDDYDTKGNHGVAVAGVIGARDNGFGVVGVAPGARTWAVQVFDETGFATLSSVVCGVEWAIANATWIDVANMSFGVLHPNDGACGRVDDDPFHQAVCALVGAGVTTVVAAGNESMDTAMFTPASFEEVITVSALADFDGKPGNLGPSDLPGCLQGLFTSLHLDQDDTFAYFSNHGAAVDLMAPGTCSMTTVPKGLYDYVSGTSFAAPHVAGAAALYRSRNPGASPAQIKRALIRSGRFDYDSATDPDGIKEPRLDVSSL